MASGGVFVGNRRVVLVDVNRAADAGEHKSSVVLDGAQLEKLASLPQLRGACTDFSSFFFFFRFLFYIPVI